MPPCTRKISTAQSSSRKLPMRWLSAKKAFEERPIVVQDSGRQIPIVVKEEKFTPITVLHFSETPV